MSDPWETDYGVVNQTASKEPNTLLGTTRSFLQGLTFGASDEIGAAIAAVPASIQTGEPWGEVYGSMMNQLGGEREAFREEHPYLSAGAEIGGGIVTGVAGAGKAAATNIGQRVVANTPRWLQAAGVGATEGGLYGFLSSDPGERTEGATTGAVVGAVSAPVGGWVLDRGGRFATGVLRWAKNKLLNAPRKEALQVMRAALEREGLDPDEAVKLYEKLGKEGMLADLGDNFRAVTRALVDEPGQGKAVAKKLLYERQKGQSGRLLNAAEDALGKRAKDLLGTVREITENRFNQAKPIYDMAYQQGIQMTDRLAAVLERPSMKAAMKAAKSIAGDYGDEFSEGSLKHLHYAKMALYDRMSAAGRTGKTQQAGAIKSTYKELLNAIGEQNKTYIRANNTWASDSAILDAANAGRKFMRMSVADLRDAVDGMSRAEMETFQLGAVASIEETLGNVRFGSDSAQKLVGTPNLVRKMSILFNGDEAAARKFMARPEIESAFTQTRNAVAGGSPTSQNLAGQKFLKDTIQPETLTAVATGDPVAAALSIGKELLGSKPLTQETLNELSYLLLNNGLTPAQVKKAFASPRFAAGIARLGEQYSTASRAAAGIAAPIAMEE